MVRRAWCAVVSIAVLATGCAGCSHHTVLSAANCGPAFQERLDPLSTRHIFPGAPAPSYLTDPPTSGPHQLGPPPTGAVTTPIPRPRQVAMLEIGYVIVQYRDLPPAAIATVAGLAGPLVTVAPSVGPLPAPVVATSWTWKVVCGTVGPATLAGLRAFIAAHRGKGFNQIVPPSA